MFIFDLTNLLSLLLVLVATILLIYLSQEIKNSKIALIPLVAFMVDLVIHTVQSLTIGQSNLQLNDTLCYNMAIDYIFILLTYFGYLWADEVDAVAHKRKTLNGSGIKWLFKKV